ncbi:MAG TPA: DUF4105 domain-containing protein [Spongiibacteraceae bacterium]|nr:DUF4105 domain-containing protein [Spongiibacteraceae bacterium]
MTNNGLPLSRDISPTRRHWYWTALRRLGLSALVLLSLWSLAALYFSPFPTAQRIALCATYLFIAGMSLWRVPSFRAACTVNILLIALVQVWWWTVPPVNDAAWQADVGRLPRIDFVGDEVRVKNIRDFEYRSEFDYSPRYLDAVYKLDDLRTLDLFLIHWGSPAIAHTILSFGFGDNRYLAVSIETRKQIGQTYSALRGFFRQFTLIYIVAIERDVIRLRTDFRNEDVYLYRLQVAPALARQVLTSYAEHINQLSERAEWYNALTENCTTSIRNDIYAYMPNKSLDWRLLANGYIDEMLYERGNLYAKIPFPELKQHSYINAKAHALSDGADYSSGIRSGLPGFEL